MNLEKLLFVTKFEDLCFDSLQSLFDLQKAGLNHVVFQHVIEREKVALQRGRGYSKEREIKLREIANIRFIDWAETIYELGMEAGVYIVVGNLVKEVLLAAEKEDTDLIVIGSEKKGKLEQFYSGSDIIELIRRGKKPVLVYKPVRKDDRYTEKPFQNIVLATDFSPACGNAVKLLCTLKNVVKKIHVIHVVSDKELKATSSMAVQKTRKETRKKLEIICDVFEQAGIETRPHVYIGNACDEIEKSARECSAGLIVTGTSGKSYFRERWIGSVPKTLAEKSNFPVLFVPPASDSQA